MHVTLHALTAHQPHQAVHNGRKTVICPTCKTPFPCAINTAAARVILQPAPPLTPAEGALLDRLRAFIAEHGYPPVLAELGPKGTVHAHLQALAVKGYIVRAPGVQRGIRILRGVA